MSTTGIVEHLRSAGYDAELVGDGKVLRARAAIGSESVELTHCLESGPFERLPTFWLVDAAKHGQLAHVRVDEKSGVGVVCVDDGDSISVNFDVPELALQESLARHLGLLKQLIEDPDWNRAELLREFHANWGVLCDSVQPQPPTLFVAAHDEVGAELRVKRPAKGFDRGIGSRFVAFSRQSCREHELAHFREAIRWDKRQESGRGVRVSIDAIEPAPAAEGDLGKWYLDAVSRVSGGDRNVFSEYCRQKSKEHWVVLSSRVESGNTVCAVRLKSKKKGPVPTSESDLGGWEIFPVVVRCLDASSLVPRGGGMLGLASRSVLLVGCGSVGSELAHRLASAGIGEFAISDPDPLSEANLYRHTLGLSWIDWQKAAGVAAQIRGKSPWIRVTPSRKRLRDWVPALRAAPDQFDLIVVAIGSPTAERLFFQELKGTGVELPVVNVWVEAYGIGGHAVLDIPETSGCLMCAYVDPESLEPGLSSNLNFIKPDQLVTRNHAGCGDRFLPYSAIAASYTATMAADLSIKFLQGEVESSSKVSWRGQSDAACAEGLDLSYRYRHFDRSLKIEPLRNPECHLCHPGG